MIVNFLSAERGELHDREGFRFFDGPAPRGELLGCSLYDLPPGQQLWPYHFHRGNEEWAVVVTGTPTVRTPEGERELGAGDIVGFPLDEDGAHTFLNHGEDDARIALFSTLNPPTYPVYPDSDKVGANRRTFRMRDAVDYWDGEKL